MLKRIADLVWFDLLELLKFLEKKGKKGKNSCVVVLLVIVVGVQSQAFITFYTLIV